MNKKCKVATCDSPVRTMEYCNAHYLSLLRTGSPMGRKYECGSNNRKILFLKSLIGTEEQNCILFPFPRNPKGYGTVSEFGKIMSAQRYSCRMAHGEPTFELAEAAHSCGNGNKGCVNPKHIRWATKSQNQNERALHGTSNRGERNGQAKLSEKEVLEIFVLAKTEIAKDLAEKHGCSSRAIRDIRSGRRWNWLTSALKGEH